MLKSAANLCALLLFGLGAFAVDNQEAPQFGYMGLGAKTCADMPSQGLHALEHPYIQWVSGYLSGIVDSTGSKRIARMDITEIAVRLITRCREHPNESISAAAKAIARSKDPIMSDMKGGHRTSDVTVEQRSP